MSQNIRAVRFVSSSRHGISCMLDGSGMAIMSDSSIGLKPLIEEPSKPMPPSKASSSSAALIEKLFSWPSRSVNQRRTKRTSFCSQNAIASLALVGPSAMSRTSYRRLTSKAPRSSYEKTEASRCLYTYEA